VANTLIHIGAIDLDFGAVSDNDEEDPGGFLCVNDDDDNGNGVPDKDEAGPTVGENDLVPLTIVVNGEQTGTLTLDAISGANRVKLYENPDRSNPVSLPQSWPLLGLPKTFAVTLYVEGVDASAAVRDVEFLLEFNSIAGTFCEDTVLLTSYQLWLKEVHFAGLKNRKLRRDTDSMPFSAPHWQDNSSPPDGDADDPNDRRYPTAFIRDSEMEAKAIFLMNPAVTLGPEVRVQGDGPGAFDFSGIAMLSASSLKTEFIHAAEPFENAVDFFDPFEISWTVSLDGGHSWCHVATSSNPIYVILDEPELPTHQRWHTLFRNSARDAEGATTQDEVLAGVWSDFTDRVVMRADPDPASHPVQLTYYDSWNCGNFTTGSLLATGDGQCGAWARFFVDLLRAHGIDHPNEMIKLEYDNPAYPPPLAGLLVRDWSFAPGGGISGDLDLPYLNIPPVLVADVIQNNTYVWRFAEVNDAPGVPGQGTVNPASFFENHQLVRINGVYYDPSYGGSYGSLVELEGSAVAGYIVRIQPPDVVSVNELQVSLDLDGDGQITDVTEDITNVFLIQQNQAGNQLQETASEYP
jgi:hypothetical protein